jgi:oligopeptidase B
MISLFIGAIFMHPPQPPKAIEKSQILEVHSDKRIDPYFWMKDRENPEVISYIKAENQYAKEVMAPVSELEEKLFAELKSRVKQDDSTLPFPLGEFSYYSRYETGKEYPIYARKKDGKEEILIDVNELAKGHSYFSVPFPVVSDDQTKIIYSADTKGRRFYTLHIFDLKTRKVLESIPDTTGNAVWANDNQTIFYSKQHPETLRSQWIYRHRLNSANDELVYEEKAESFFTGVRKSRNKKTIFISNNSTTADEYLFLDADQAMGKFEIVFPREKSHEYSVMDGGDGFYFVTNWQAKNFRLMKGARGKSTKETWQEIVPHSKENLLEGASFFEKYFVLSERADGLTRLKVFDRASLKSEIIDFPDPTYVASENVNAEYNTNKFRYSYQSLNRPESIFEYDFSTKKSELKKQKETPNLDPSQYISERLWATARDGTKIPISLLRKRSTNKDGKAPLLQYGYGSYGYSMEPWFSASNFSLVDRGFIYAIAHVRGGSEMGRHWYEDGKLLKKKNTFTDFIDVTEFLIKEKVADPKKIYAEGGSAGGLLMGAISNMRPDLYRGIHAAVPFVDVVTTMLDDSIPLTTFEYEEWGNPNEKTYYDYIKSYSPYDNVEKKAYPNILITSGLHDSQVQFWEPTKWTAKLRKMNISKSKILLHTEMEAGHGGSSGRFQKLKERAREFAFFLLMETKNEF